MPGAPTLLRGDCRDHMLQLALDGAQFDAVVTDPPYDLTSIVKRFGSATAAPAKSDGPTGVFARASRGFMGQTWDGTGVAFDPFTWSLAYDVMKPGAHLVAFGGSRTWHRMAVAIEDAGFEIRDTLTWLYGTGFPKSHDVSKAIDKSLGAKGGRGAPKLLPNGREHHYNIGFGEGEGYAAAPAERFDYVAATSEAAAWDGWGTALKPAFEPIILARKPLVGTIAANVLQHGVGGLNIDACRVPVEDRETYEANCSGDRGHAENRSRDSDYGLGCGSASALGRWPANVLHDGSDEVLAAFAAYGEKNGGHHPKARGKGGVSTSGHSGQGGLEERHSDTGTAARFFYSAKAGKADRAGSKHPTVKPLALMRWLCTLVVPPGGHILDPFAGSGSTLQAAYERGFDATGCEMTPEYQDDIERRIAAMQAEFEVLCA